MFATCQRVHFISSEEKNDEQNTAGMTLQESQDIYVVSVPVQPQGPRQRYFQRGVPGFSNNPISLGV